MPEYEIVVEVLAYHRVNVNHPTKEAAMEDAVEIAKRHTEGEIVRVGVRRIADITPFPTAGDGEPFEIGGQGIDGNGRP